jgi:hypothetical protein
MVRYFLLFMEAGRGDGSAVVSVFEQVAVRMFVDRSTSPWGCFHTVKPKAVSLPHLRNSFSFTHYTLFQN